MVSLSPSTCADWCTTQPRCMGGVGLFPEGDVGDRTPQGVSRGVLCVPHFPMGL
jgi:hypothetical protein